MLALPIVESPMAESLPFRPCLPAACALHHNIAVIHRGRDYNVLAEISPLKARTIS